MYKIYIILFFFFLCIQTFGTSLKTELSGRVTDKNTNEPIPGVTLYLPDLKIGTVSGMDGKYTLVNLPKTRVLVHVSMVGYRSVVKTLDLSTVNSMDFVLEYVATEINEVVITGLSKATEQKRTPTPMSIVSRTELLQNTSSNIIDAIASQPGISQITTGSGISKPVIRGLGYNRVVTVQDGIRQEGQQWGDEHGIEIDEYAVNRVEILKGPASLAYGSDAIAGVINLLSAPSLPEGKIAGNVTTNYQTNNGLIGYSFDFAGNKKGLIWDLRYSNKMAHAYKNKYDGYVFNSGFKENAESGMIGINRAWGFSHLELSAYSLTPGIIEGDRDSLTGKFTKLNFNNGTEDIANYKDFKSYTPRVPFQRVFHYKAVLNNNFVLGEGSLKSTFGYQQNHRQEFGEDPDHYGLYFLLNTLNYDIRYNLPEFNHLDLSLGVNGMKQQSLNKGTEFLVPEYNLFDFGIFSIVHKSLGELDISGGLRYDVRSEKGADLFLNASGEKVGSLETDGVHRFIAFNSSFSGISGSFGATWQVSKTVYTKINMSRGYRAPNIGELASNGVHEGTLRYEMGDAKLKPETSIQFDYTFGLNTEHISAEATVFHNTIDNYIFLQKLSNVAGSDSLINQNSVFHFVSGNAALYGGEIRFDIHPHPFDWLHFENAFSFVQANLKNQPDSSRHLPLTPASKLQSSIRVDVKKLNQWMGNFYAKFGVDYYFAQDNFYAAYGTETRTPDYALLNLGVGADVIQSARTFCSIYISMNNITDKAYQSHLSRLKYAAENYATGRTGIYNMGRNISFKLVIPVNF